MKTQKKRKEPLWKGPEVDGVTQSMLNRFLECRERFRLGVIEGLTTIPKFDKNLEFGSMWHICEEYHAGEKDWQQPLREYAKKLLQQFKDSQEQISKWYNVVKLQFPIYIDYWDRQKQIQRAKVEPVCSEQCFRVEYPLPSGRVVLLRGRWDNIDYELRKAKGKLSKHLRLQENKTKGEIDDELMRRQLTFDMQTMIYIVALELDKKEPVRDLMYNVIRRPLSGGKHSIRPHKGTKNKDPETMDHYYERLAGLIQEEPEHYFFRWKVQITKQEIEDFKRQFPTPVLEQLCNWYDWVTSPIGMKDPFLCVGPNRGVGLHWRTPYGIYSALAKGRPTDLDNYLVTGSEVGLARDGKLFTELEE